MSKYEPSESQAKIGDISVPQSLKLSFSQFVHKIVKEETKKKPYGQPVNINERAAKLLGISVDEFNQMEDKAKQDAIQVSLFALREEALKNNEKIRFTIPEKDGQIWEIVPESLDIDI